jgi:Na+/H+ antiporter NhaD/arsenite permease-like protein
MNPKVLALVVFVGIYALIASEKIERTIVAIWGVLLFLILPVATQGGVRMGLLNYEELVRYVNWEALGLIFGMFTLVSILRESGFFRYLGLSVLKRTKFNIYWIFILFALTSALLSAFMDSITVLLFMSTLTLETCALLKVNPVPFIFLEIASANIGGSATMVGDPPNIIIGTGCNFSFMDFLVNTGPVAGIALAVNLLFFFLWYRKFLREKSTELKDFHKVNSIDPASAIINKKLMRNTLVFFCLSIGLLTVHHSLHLSVAFVGILGASIALLFGGKPVEEVIEKIDWKTLIFFTCLFVMVGGLEKSGVLADFANALGSMSKGHPIFTVFAILWASAFLSSVIDNVPFAALMVPVIKNLSFLYGFPLEVLAWSLALGTDIGGNGTPIGASANVVGLSVAKKSGVKITWGQYCKVSMPAMMISVATCMLVLYLRYLR